MYALTKTLKNLCRVFVTLALLPQVPGVASHGPLSPNLLQVADHHCGHESFGHLILLIMLRMTFSSLSYSFSAKKQTNCLPPASEHMSVLNCDLSGNFCCLWCSRSDCLFCRTPHKGRENGLKYQNIKILVQNEINSSFLKTGYVGLGDSFGLI